LKLFKELEKKVTGMISDMLLIHMALESNSSTLPVLKNYTKKFDIVTQDDIDLEDSKFVSVFTRI